MKLNIKKIIKEELNKIIVEQSAQVQPPTAPAPSNTVTKPTDTKQATVKYGTFNIGTLKKLVSLNNDMLFTQALTKIKNNQTDKLTNAEKTEIVSFFSKLFALDDASKTKVFNLLRQNVKVTK